MISIISQPPAGTGKLAVIFFSPRTEKIYSVEIAQKRVYQHCSMCVLRQVHSGKQQKPKEGSMYTLDLTVLARCMSNQNLGLRGLLVAEATSHIVLDEKRVPSSRPAGCFCSGHVFADDRLKPLSNTKAAREDNVDPKQIPPLFLAVLFAPP